MSVLRAITKVSITRFIGDAIPGVDTDGTTYTDIKTINCNLSFGMDQVSATCNLTIYSPLDSDGNSVIFKPMDRILIKQGWDNTKDLKTTFFGFIDSVSLDNPPKTQSIKCRDILKLAQNNYYIHKYRKLYYVDSVADELDASGSPLGGQSHADRQLESVISDFLIESGIPTYFQSLPTTNITIGENNPVVFEYESASDAIQRLCDITEYRLWADSCGTVRMRKIQAIASGTPDIMLNHEYSDYGYALSFDGNNDTVTVSDDDSLDITDILSIELWLKVSAFTNDNIIEKGGRGGGTNNWALYTNDTNDLRFGAGFNGSWSSYEVFPNLTTDVWHHLVITYDGSYIRAYKNGIADTPISRSGTLSTNSSNLLIGGGDGFLSGSIDEVRIYHRVLSQSEIKYNYNGGSGRYEPYNYEDLVGWWHFDEGSGTTAYDETGVNNGSISGATWVTGKVSRIVDGNIINLETTVDDDLRNWITVICGYDKDITTTIAGPSRYVTTPPQYRKVEIQSYLLDTQDMVDKVAIKMYTDLNRLGYSARCSALGNAGLRLGQTIAFKDDFASNTVWIDGYALDFDSSYVDCGSGNTLRIADVLTVEGWFNFDSATGNEQAIIGNHEEAYYGYRLAVSDSTPWAKFKFSLGSGGGAWAIDMDSTTYVLPDVWYHVVSTYDGSVAKMYLNGDLKTTSATVSGAIVYSGLPNLFFGKRNSVGNEEYFSGKVDEVRIYNRVFELSEVVANYNGGSGRSEPYDRSDVVGIWHFEENTGSVAGDDSGKINNGIISGATWVIGKVKESRSDVYFVYDYSTSHSANGGWIAEINAVGGGGTGSPVIGNIAPVAQFLTDIVKTTLEGGDTYYQVLVNAADSYDPNGNNLAYSWASSGYAGASTVQHVYDVYSGGYMDITLTVTDDGIPALSDSLTQSVTLSGLGGTPSSGSSIKEKALFFASGTFVYCSKDGGKTWSSTNLSSNITSLAADPKYKTCLAATANYNLYKINWNGSSWDSTLVAYGVDSQITSIYMDYVNNLQDLPNNQITWVGNAAGDVYISKDSLTSFRRVYGFSIANSSDYSIVKIDGSEIDSNSVVVVTTNKVFNTRDLGSSWRTIVSSIPSVGKQWQDVKVFSNEIQLLAPSYVKRSSNFGIKWNSSSFFNDFSDGEAISFSKLDTKRTMVVADGGLYIYNKGDTYYRYTSGGAIDGNGQCSAVDLDADLAYIGTSTKLYQTIDFGATVRELYAANISAIAVGGSYLYEG